jgi:hypothetical protein
VRIVHKVCTMIRRWDAVNELIVDTPEARRCLECPAWEASPHGRVKSLCRGKAEEFVKIVKTGNPWGKKNCAWPSPPKDCEKP